MMRLITNKDAPYDQTKGSFFTVVIRLA